MSREISVEIMSVAPRQSGEEFAVTFSVKNGDGQTEQTSFIISSEQYLLFAPRKGSSSVAEYEVVERAAEVYRATKKAIFLLGYGSCSKKRLCQKLCAKGFKRDIAYEAVEAIESKGLLDSVADAEREAEKCFLKHLGKRRIAAELFSKGYTEESVKKALDSLEEKGVDYVMSCASYIKKKYPSSPPNSSDELKKLYSSLLRRGFSSDEIKKASNTIFKAM
ncbi:MAG: regulatory protein RecX [Clostridia bacterium]|nr:regulatory protein RecX [Clostridia bacterium]